MATPLTPLSAADLNLKSSSRSTRRITLPEPADLTPKDCPEDRENNEPSLRRSVSSKSVGSRSTSPVKADEHPGKALRHGTVRTPAKPAQSALLVEFSPETKTPGPAQSVQSTPMRDNEGLTGAIERMEMENKPREVDDVFDDEDDGMTAVGADFSSNNMDDSALSGFSAVPNMDMTLFARLGQGQSWSRGGSPSKHSTMGTPQRGAGPERTPLRSQPSYTPATSRRTYIDDQTASPSPTPRGKPATSYETDTTDLILDFTDQFNALAASSTSYTYATPSRRARLSPTKSQTKPSLALHMARARTPSPAKRALPAATPSERRNLATLLDFDIPPAPTPRSLPTVTARELESLKSSYLSQISSLKASLSGKEAETRCLMEAVSDAERRVGEAQEGLREDRGAREVLQTEKDSWEQRAKEMESVIRSVKDEVLSSERERAELTTKVEEAERRREEAETKAAAAESRVAAMKTSRSTSDSSPGVSPKGGSSKEVEAAVEKVARELHALYKAKHETKVEALKKSYGTRWEKRVQELEQRLEAATNEVEELRTSRDMTLTGVVLPSNAHAHADFKAHEDAMVRAEETRSALEEAKARMTGLAEELASVKRDNDLLIHELEKERVEKGELVAAVEELLSMQGNSSVVVTADGAAGGVDSIVGADGIGGGGGGGGSGDSGNRGEGGSTSKMTGLAGAGLNTGVSTSGSTSVATAHGPDSFRSSLTRPSSRRARTVAGGSGIVAGESRIGRVGSGVGGGGGFGVSAGSTTTTTTGGLFRSHSGGATSIGSGSGSGRGSVGGGVTKSGIMSNIERMGKGGSLH